MIPCTRTLPKILPLLIAACFTGCQCGPGVSLPPVDDYDAGHDAGDKNPCGVDCSKLKAAKCMVSVCNTGQFPGPKDTCTEVPADDGTTCDDGKFCTSNDFCDHGVCVGGSKNDCGMGHDSCTSVICYEESHSCTSTPANDGTACAPSDKCTVNGVCTVGTCIGVPKDCSSSPLAECNTMMCDPMNGLCVATPDPTQDGNPCVYTGDLCKVGKSCSAGQCVGGTPKDCSSIDVGCAVGACEPTSGMCQLENAPAGASCTNGVQACQNGTCDGAGRCMASTAPDGSACNDHNACTQTDTCTSGACGGTAVSGCTRYLAEGFETC